MNKIEIISDDEMVMVCCPKCNNLIGIRSKRQNDPKIEKVRLIIGEVKYPTIDLKNIETMFCPVCGHKFKVQGKT